MAADQATDHPLERLIFFSDAVFAIAITLLVIEIHPPHLNHGVPDTEHWIELAKLIPNFVGYGVSFAVIGAFWAGHHRSFSLARHYDGRILVWNLLLLGTIAFLPFVTAYMSANPGERVPTLFYCTWLLIAALCNYRVNSMVVSPPMVGEEVTREQRLSIQHRALSVIFGAATAVLISFIEPKLGQAGLISIPLWRPVIAQLKKS